MSRRLTEPSPRVRARGAGVATALLGLLAGGLLAVAPAHADSAGGVSIDLGAVTDGNGFVADQYGVGGGTDTFPAGRPSLPNWGPTVAHPLPVAVWNTSHVGETHYTVPGLTPGATYQVRLYFMDWYFTHAGQRKFDVVINGTNVLTNFDIIGAAQDRGADGALPFGVEKDFPATVKADGTVSIDFNRNSADQPQVNAIVIAPDNTSPAPAPSNAGGVSVDLGGKAGDGFIADQYGVGGGTDTFPAGRPSLPNWGPTVAHPLPVAVWNTSHVGETHYTVPGLTPGATYQVRLYFMDWYFTHAGQRKFDVVINGTNVLTNFDIIGAAQDRGADGALPFGVEKDFPATVKADGTVSIDFNRNSADQPQVNAMVITPAA